MSSARNISTVVEAPPKLIYAEFGRRLIIVPDEGEDTGALFEQVCSTFETSKIEQDSEGNVSIMAPTGTESSYQNNHLNSQLLSWAIEDERGKAFDSNALFILPDGSRLGPDGCWVSDERLAMLSKEQRRQFSPVVPEFVIELKSPSDRLTKLKEKMEKWLRNGVSLAWMIDPEKRYSLVYRQGVDEPETIREPVLNGEGPVAGFRLDLEPIWKGLDLD